jgi:hypothetical protein
MWLFSSGNYFILVIYVNYVIVIPNDGNHVAVFQKSGHSFQRIINHKNIIFALFNGALKNPL